MAITSKTFTTKAVPEEPGISSYKPILSLTFKILLLFIKIKYMVKFSEIYLVNSYISVLLINDYIRSTLVYSYLVLEAAVHPRYKTCLGPKAVRK